MVQTCLHFGGGGRIIKKSKSSYMNDEFKARLDDMRSYSKKESEEEKDEKKRRMS